MTSQLFFHLVLVVIVQESVVIGQLLWHSYLSHHTCITYIPTIVTYHTYYCDLSYLLMEAYHTCIPITPYMHTYHTYYWGISYMHTYHTYYCDLSYLIFWPIIPTFVNYHTYYCNLSYLLLRTVIPTNMTYHTYYCDQSYPLLWPITHTNGGIKRNNILLQYFI